MCAVKRCAASSLQGGEDPYDAVSRGSLSAKEQIIIGLFCGK